MGALRKHRTAVLLTAVVTLALSSAVSAQTAAPPPRTITGLVVLNNGVGVETNSTEYVDVPGATTRVYTATNGMVVANFSAESRCYDSFGTCSVRVLVDGVSALPNGGTDVVFDSAWDGMTDSHSIERSARRLAEGYHDVIVQYAVTGNDTKFQLDDWHLTVMGIR